jgi:hypothetical protein
MQRLKSSSSERRRPLHAGFVVDKVSLGYDDDDDGALRVSLVTVMPSLPHTVVRNRTKGDLPAKAMLFWKSGNGRKEMCYWCLYRTVNEPTCIYVEQCFVAVCR